MYKYYNANPKKEIAGDCVVRALSLALNINYYKIIELLYKTSNYFNCDMLVRDCYSNLLEKKFKLKRITPHNRTVEEISDRYYRNTLIIRIRNHLTCSINQVIYDTWNPSNEIVDCFWIVK